MSMRIIMICSVLLGCLSSASLSAMELQAKMLAQGSALIEIDGKSRMLRTGASSPEGVKLIAANSQEATVEIEGKRRLLKLNRQISTQFKKAEKAEVRIASTRGGHHITPGRINGLPVEFMVDTGASVVAMNYREAEKLGIDYRAGTPISVNTANGVAKAYRVVLHRVSIGDIELHQVSAAVNASEWPRVILLGNSYLSQVDLSVDSGVLVLREK